MDNYTTIFKCKTNHMLFWNYQLVISIYHVQKMKHVPSSNNFFALYNKFQLSKLVAC
jgi:hypothetical protein